MKNFKFHTGSNMKIIYYSNLIAALLLTFLFHNDFAEFPIKKFHQFSPEKITQLLPELFQKYPNFEDRLKAIALARLGTPYDLKATGDGSGFEAAPIFRTNVTNCTIFVLTNIALASSKTYQQAESAMVKLNYYPVPTGQNPVYYENRIHFTTDRLLTSKYFELITTKIAKQGELDTIKLTLNRQNDGSFFLPVAWEKYVELPFIPQKHITAKLLKNLPAVCGVGIIRQGLFSKGIIVAHEGLVFDGKNFVHASRDANKVIQQDFYLYTQKKQKGSGKPVCDGIIIYSVKQVD